MGLAWSVHTLCAPLVYGLIEALARLSLYSILYFNTSTCLQEKMLDSLSSRVEDEHNKLTAEIRAKDQTISSVQQRLESAEKNSKLATDLEAQLQESHKVPRQAGWGRALHPQISLILLNSNSFGIVLLLNWGDNPDLSYTWLCNTPTSV